MSKNLEKAIVLLIGVTLLASGGTFAADNKKDHTDTPVGLIKVYVEDWDNEAWESKESKNVFKLFSSGADFVEDLKKAYKLSDTDAEKLEKLYDEIVKKDNGAVEISGKLAKAWENIDSILEKYAKNSDANKVYKVDDMSDYVIQFEQTESGDDSFGIYDSEGNGVESENMTEEQFMDDMFEHIKNYTASDFFEDLPIEFNSSEKVKIESIHVELIRAATEKNLKKVYELYERLQEILTKYQDEIDEYYETITS